SALFPYTTLFRSQLEAGPLLVLPHGGDVRAELGDRARDVGRAAGARVPLLALGGGVLLVEAIRAALQRIGVEEAGAAGVDRCGQRIVDLPFDHVPVAGVVAGGQHAPGRVEVRDGRA